MGRHRQSTSHPTLATAAITGGLAITGSFALPAVAAEASTSSVDWDAVAACESSGNWAAVDASGHHLGGLQFTDSTWHAFGGTGRPQDASRSEQISVAERVLAGQGIGAWPVCGPKGLGGHTSGAAHTTSHATSPTTSSGYTPTRRSHPDTPPQPHSTTAPHHHSAPHPPAARTHRVLPGDTLSGIAARYRVPGGWPALHALNRAIVPNPNAIFPGQTLRVA